MADEQPVVEVEARAMGWVPREEFRGAEDKWVDADAFVERGRSVLPILQKNNERLHTDLQTIKGEVGGLKDALKAAQAVIETLNASHEEDVRAQVEAARAALREELAEASEAGDHKAIADITDKMTQLGRAEDKADEKAVAAAPPGKAEDLLNTPFGREVKSWWEQHPAFAKDRRKVALANAVSVDLRERGNTKMGSAFLDEVAEEVEKALGGASEAGGDPRVAAGGGGGSRRQSGKTYSDLPAEAKAICDKMSPRLVGPNRAHKDVAAWRTSYVSQYFGEQS